MSAPVTFTCSCCGQVYDEMPLCFGGQYPDYYFDVPPDEREARIELSESLCVIDDHYFHRGRITIPIIDYEEDLTFNVWTTISKANFELRSELWDDPKRIEQQPYFGWLQTLVPTYGSTLNLKTIAHESEVGYIPAIKVTDDHQLRYDQEHGITFQEALNKVQQILKEWHKGG
ncbi:DUF2199 domain-containing protein [Mucilaginibacter lacusdianchii]|uniref:DUF2199 domain-containing protein n=1 Tax=Mucilaginibacter lacusdianchii TaxID=2684211 RepID=UPI00131BD972|nr:DUF2199 domain-containing protein [Mucilaginibacter sp. JXJ CY 39]